MLGIFVARSISSADELVPPDVIPEVNAAQQAHLSEVDEVSVQGGAVPPMLSQRGEHLAVCRWAPFIMQRAKDRDARRGRAQASGAQGVA
jgi:hypothetical protein